MATLESLIDQLKLSNDPLYQSLDPEQAASWATELQNIYLEPANKLALQNLGVDANQLLDAPTTAFGIQQAREMWKKQRTQQDAELFSLGGMLPDVIAQNIGGVSRGAASVAEQFGLADADTTPSPLEAQAFGTSIPQVAGSILGNLAAFAPAAAGGGAGLLALGASPTVASIGSFALAGGGLEALRQVGRNTAKGEPYSVANLMAETAIAGAGGVPVSRPLAALAAAGTAGAAGILGADVDARRVGAEALFALLFGNPRIADVGTNPKAAVDDPVLPINRNELKHDPALLTELDEALGVMGKTKRGTIFVNPNQLTRLMMMASNVDDPTAKSIARARFESTKELTQTHTTTELQQVFRDPTENPIIKVIAADAAAHQTGQTRPVDAPATPTSNVAKDMQTIWNDGDSEFARQLTPERFNENRAEIAQQESIQKAVGGDREDPFASGPGMWVTDKLVDARAEKRTIGDFPKPVNEHTIRQAARAEHAAEGRAYVQVSDDYVLRLAEMDDVIKKAKSEGVSKTELNSMEERRVRMTNELTASLAGDIKVQNETIASGVFDLMLKAANTKADAANMLEGMPEALRMGAWPEWAGKLVDRRFREIMRPHEKSKFQRQLKRSIDTLAEYGAEIQDPFRDTVNAIIHAIEKSSITKGRLRQIGGVSGTLDGIAEAIPNSFYKNYIKDLKPKQRKALVKDINSLLFEPAQLTRTGVSLNRVRREGFKYGLRISNDFEVSAFGFAHKFKSLTDTAKYIQDITKGTIVDPIVLKSEAARRNASVKHVGEGEYVIADHHNGTIEVANSPEEAVKVLRDKPDLSVDAPDLTPGAPVHLSGVAARQGWNMEDIRLEHIPGTNTQARIANSSVIRNARNARSLAQDIESMTGERVKAYTDLFLPIQEAVEVRAAYERPFTKDLQAMRRLTGRWKTTGIQESLASPASLSDVAKLHNLNSKEIKVVKGMQNWYRELLDIEPVKLAKTLQEFRRNAGDPNRAQSAFMLPAELEFARQGILEGRVRLDNDNFVAVAADLLRERGNYLHLRKLAPQIDSTINSVKKWAGTKATRLTLLESMSHVRDAARGEHGSSAQWLAEAMTGEHGVLNFLRDRGFIKDVKASDIDRAFNSMATYFSGTAMSARPALVIRNAVQSLMPGWKVGYSNNLRGIIRAGRDGAQERALAAGAIGNDLTGVYLMDEMKGLSEGFIQKLQRVGLTWYRKMDRRNRLNTFYSGVEAIEREAPRLMTGNQSWDSFLVNTGLAGDSDFIQRSVLRKLKNEGVDEAANFYGKFLTEETQFLYSKIAAPNYFQGTYGRVFGQFGIWPLQYWEYVTRNIGFGAQGRGLSSSTARVNYSTKFVGRAMAQIAGVSALGAALGVNTTTFNFANPFDYEGGPIIQALRDFVGAVGGSTHEKTMAKANLKRALANFTIPFRSAIHDWAEAADENDPAMALLLAMGFNPRERNR